MKMCRVDRSPTTSLGVERIPAEAGEVTTQSRLKGRDRSRAAEGEPGKLAKPGLSWAGFWSCYSEMPRVQQRGGGLLKWMRDACLSTGSGKGAPCLFVPGLAPPQTQLGFPCPEPRRLP